MNDGGSSTTTRAHTLVVDYIKVMGACLSMPVE